MRVKPINTDLEKGDGHKAVRGKWLGVGSITDQYPALYYSVN